MRLRAVALVAVTVPRLRMSLRWQGRGGRLARRVAGARAAPGGRCRARQQPGPARERHRCAPGPGIAASPALRLVTAADARPRPWGGSCCGSGGLAGQAVLAGRAPSPRTSSSPTHGRRPELPSWGSAGGWGWRPDITTSSSGPRAWGMPATFARRPRRSAWSTRSARPRWPSAAAGGGSPSSPSRPSTFSGPTVLGSYRHSADAAPRRRGLPAAQWDLSAGAQPGGPAFRRWPLPVTRELLASPGIGRLGPSPRPLLARPRWTSAAPARLLLGGGLMLRRQRLEQLWREPVAAGRVRAGGAGCCPGSSRWPPAASWSSPATGTRCRSGTTP